MSPHAAGADGLDDVTVVGAQRAADQSALPAAPPAAEPDPPPADISEFLGRGLNPLVQAASPLLLLAVQLRHSAAAGDAQALREQVRTQIRKFDARAAEAGASAQAATAARYVLCAMVDEAVLNSPWGERSGWSRETLLVAFHGESYGGAKFFLLLDRLLADVPRHIDLLELMYVCLALGFAGRYQIEAGGRARLADIQDDLYRRIRARRGAPPEALAPHWQGDSGRRRRARGVPLWVAAAAAACLVLGVFLWLHARLNAQASPISAEAARIGLETAVPPGDVPAPVPQVTLRQLLAAEAGAGLLDIDEDADGRARVRLGAATMFASGGTEVGEDARALLGRIAAALQRLPGRAIVVGHTDDQPLRSLRFKDNYALSTERARAVAEVLAAGLSDPQRLDVVGAGASQPIATPASLPANRDRNRRVEILFQPALQPRLQPVRQPSSQPVPAAAPMPAGG